MKFNKALKFLRKQVRYHLYRIRNEVEGGAKADIPKEYRGIKKYYESSYGFGEWENFARLWDIGPEGYHDKIVRIDKSEEQKWQEKLDELVQEPLVNEESDGSEGNI